VGHKKLALLFLDFSRITLANDNSSFTVAFRDELLLHFPAKFEYLSMNFYSRYLMKEW